jgi:hypothetical protein
MGIIGFVVGVYMLAILFVKLDTPSFLFVGIHGGHGVPGKIADMW